MQDSGSRSPSPGGLEQKNRAETAEKTTYMRSEGGTQTEDLERMDQDVWMGYNHVNPAVGLAGRGTGGRSPAFQGAHVSPWFPGGFTQVPFCPATPAVPKAGCGTVPGFYASGGSGPTCPMVPFGVPWGFPGSFMVHPGYGSVLPGCSNPEVSQSGTPKPSASCKVTATGTKRRREDGRESETEDDLDGEDTVHLLDEHEALEFVEFDPSVQANDKWQASEPMSAFLDKHFNRSLSEEEREAIMQDFPKPNCDVLVTPRIDKEVREQLKGKGKDAHWGAEKPLYKIQEQLLDVSGPLTYLWADLMKKEVSLSTEDVLLTVQRALVLLGSASHSISLERRRIAWARLNPKLKALATENYEKRETNLFGPTFMEKATKRVEANKALEKVTGSTPQAGAPPHKKPRIQGRKQDDLRSFLSKGASAQCGGRQNQRHQPYTYTRFPKTQYFSRATTYKRKVNSHQ